MRARQRLSQLVRRRARDARRIGAAFGPACRHLADRLAYRPREVVVVALLAGGLCGGLVVERWRARFPATAERLEAEPPRLASAVAAPSPPRPRAAPPRCNPWPGRPMGDAGRAGSGRPGLDLNRATPAELARLAGISRGMAARIVAARDAFQRAGAAEAPPQ